MAIWYFLPRMRIYVSIGSAARSVCTNTPNYVDVYTQTIIIIFLLLHAPTPLQSREDRNSRSIFDEKLFKLWPPPKWMNQIRFDHLFDAKFAFADNTRPLREMMQINLMASSGWRVSSGDESVSKRHKRISNRNSRESGSESHYEGVLTDEKRWLLSVLKELKVADQRSASLIEFEFCGETIIFIHLL